MPGQSFIRAVYQAAFAPEFAGKLVFIEDYDIDTARRLVQGADVWLNNPRRPLEASGTSGEKAALNGALNFSVLDGWWAEGYTGKDGWAIGDPEKQYATEAEQDADDAKSLYDVLENQIVPLFYERDADGLPHGWLEIIKTSVMTLTPTYSTRRMLREYCQYYVNAITVSEGVSSAANK